MDKHTQKTSSRSLTGDEELKVEAGPPKSGSERLSFGSAGKSVVLGDAMAHELGHLLLGVSSHAPRGVMKAEWHSEELEQAAQGTLIFHGKSAAVWRRTFEVDSRIAPQVADLANREPTVASSSRRTRNLKYRITSADPSLMGARSTVCFGPTNVMNTDAVAKRV
jgi:hypothetical protein